MALSAKERQQKYRKNHRGKSARIDMIVDLSTSVELEDMALHGNVSKKDFLIALIDKEYRRLINDDSTGFDDFLVKINREKVAQSLADEPLDIDMLHGNDKSDD